jgi:hypothetical protein
MPAKKGRQKQYMQQREKQSTSKKKTTAGLQVCQQQQNPGRHQ